MTSKKTNFVIEPVLPVCSTNFRGDYFEAHFSSLLKSDNSQERIIAIEGLLEYGNPAKLETTLIGALNDTDGEVRWTAADGLLDRGFSTEARDALHTLSSNDPFPVVREVAWHAYTKIKRELSQTPTQLMDTPVPCMASRFARKMTLGQCKEYLTGIGQEDTVEWLVKEDAPLEDWRGWVDQFDPVIDGLVHVLLESKKNNDGATQPQDDESPCWMN